MAWRGLAWRGVEWRKPLRWYLFLLFTSFPLFDLSKTVHDTKRGGDALKIASFNVQIFGAKKMKNLMVKDVVIKVGRPWNCHEEYLHRVFTLQFG